VDGHRPRARELADAVRAGVGGLQVRSAVLIGEGMDNLAYEVNGELVVRFSKEPDATRRSELVSAEAGLLAAVAAISPLPVPQPVFTDPGRGCWAYLKLPGVPLLDLPLPWRPAHAAAVGIVLGTFLAAVHAAPLARMAAFVDPDEVPMTQWRDEAAGNYTAVIGAIPADRRRAVEAFLAASPPDRGGAVVFCHNDLGIEHVLVTRDSGTVTGVIDWSDAALTDPARDFGLVYRDLGPAALAAALTSYPAADTAALRERAAFYARCGLLEDLAYGGQTGLNAYTEKSLAALPWLLPA
jgi:aminoglycoside phosphotransferase (APT) family kinase protein